MAPTRRGRWVTRDAGGYQAALGTRNTARILKAAKESKEDLVEQEADAVAEQPEHPMPFPLQLDSYYLSNSPGELLLKEVEIAEVETTPTERRNVLKTLGLIMQVVYADELKAIPDFTDRNHDRVWDWRSVILSVNEYGAFAYAVVNDRELRDALGNVSYDWTPLDSSRGILSVRKQCMLQRYLTRALHYIILSALYDNDHLMALIDRAKLELRTRASVLTGTVEGLRTPCRCFRFQPKPKSEKTKEETEEEEEKEEEEEGAPRPSDGIQDFVLEVGMGEKNQVLPELAKSYIERGTLCVMTASIKSQGEYDFDWSYSLYRRGEARRLPGQVTRYEVVCAVQDARVIVDENNKVKFPAGLTLFDFVPQSVLENYGITRQDKSTKLDLAMRLGRLEMMERNDVFRFLCCGAPISQHLRRFNKLLGKSNRAAGSGWSNIYDIGSPRMEGWNISWCNDDFGTVVNSTEHSTLLSQNN